MKHTPKGKQKETCVRVRPAYATLPPAYAVNMWKCGVASWTKNPQREVKRGFLIRSWEKNFCGILRTLPIHRSDDYSLLLFGGDPSVTCQWWHSSEPCRHVHCDARWTFEHPGDQRCAVIVKNFEHSLGKTHHFGAPPFSSKQKIRVSLAIDDGILQNLEPCRPSRCAVIVKCFEHPLGKTHHFGDPPFSSTPEIRSHLLVMTAFFRTLPTIVMR